MSKLHVAGAAMGVLALVSAAALLWRIWFTLPLWLTLLAIVALLLSVEQVVLVRREIRLRWHDDCDASDCKQERNAF
jgi:hypothetical protein